ncbi:hypothetical protein, partial [Chryseobacterium rhizosphaerae]|uniref:hypothetical protein n=1 Tax=Chryseobacterium rhizosphaerae TaxID=395937 RepID=UPI0019D452AD
SFLCHCEKIYFIVLIMDFITTWYFYFSLLISVAKQRYCSKATEPVVYYASNNKERNHRKCLTKKR